MERRIADIEYEQMLLSRFTVAQHRDGDGLDRSVYLLMSRIASQGPMSIGELSTAFRLDASTLQRQTTVAVREGFLERILDPAGSAARKFSLTTSGQTRLREVSEHSVSALKRILADWPDADVNMFADLMHRFNVSIEDYRETKAK
ncbi:MarR family winged helix-turn-helix transcriptional regulator [Arthrobacter glacialis]|uniref:MarR family transcriptional regulator n=1 Tax=Arthrobacter glacialis TaxID=1664 RepID=A0A2S3ZRY9_ARTGL|nr:MarR family winged helix-turn-helix transcriptional regulator [Arthrobacter glacialis]POH59758.1 MarR family transcriptional regulator [Arthrobacter glacialis]POH71943.1 MarR family transcriptional regulator [Arthrobacter glacialis]